MSPPESTVALLSTPPEETTSVPPLDTRVALAAPPDSTVSDPPPSRVALSVVSKAPLEIVTPLITAVDACGPAEKLEPLETTSPSSSSAPPAFTNDPFAATPEARISSPPLETVTALTRPPDRTVSAPPERTVVLIAIKVAPAARVTPLSWVVLVTGPTVNALPLEITAPSSSNVAPDATWTELSVAPAWNRSRPPLATAKPSTCAPARASTVPLAMPPPDRRPPAEMTAPLIEPPTASDTVAPL